MNAVAKEAVGEIYNIEAMRHAQAMTWKAIDQVSERIKPGMLVGGSGLGQTGAGRA